MLEKGNLALLNVLHASRRAELLESLKHWDVAAWTLDGAGVRDAEGLFSAADKSLPAPFGVHPVGDWDAFGDNVWELVALTPGSECALVWEHAEGLLAASVGHFVEAVVALHAIARKLANPASPGAAAKLLYVFVLGDGPNFGS